MKIPNLSKSVHTSCENKWLISNLDILYAFDNISVARNNSDLVENFFSEHSFHISLFSSTVARGV